jgi:hypothetical protein
MTTNFLPTNLWETVPFGDADAFDDWNLQHWLTHVALATKTGTPLVPLDSLRKDTFPHAQLHQALAVKLGIPSTYDFAGYDLNDQNSYYEFQLSHAAAHATLAQAAGL